MRQTLAGHDVWSETDGQGDARMFVHCSLGRGKVLRPLADQLPPARNIFFDMPGHGRSAPWSGGAYQSDIVDIMAALLEGPTHIIGHSFGATAALRLAVDRPDLVSRVTLIEPVMFAAARGTPAHDRHKTAMAPFVTAWQKGDRMAATQTFFAMWGGGEQWGEISARRQQLMVDQIHLIPAAAPAIEDDIHDILGCLGHVTCPVDLIEGSHSQPVMPAILDGLAAALPQSHRTVIKGAGHMVAITHPEQIALAVERG